MAGLALFAFIVWKTGVRQILDVFAAADPVRLALSPLFILLIMIVRGIRWRVIMRGVGIDYSVARATAVWTIGFFASAVTPAKAGDAVRAFYVRADSGRSFGEAFLTVFVDRLWDLLFVLGGGLITLVVFSRRYIEIPSFWLVIGATLMIAAVAVVATNRTAMKKLLQPLFGLLVPAQYKERFSLNFHSFYDSLQSYRGQGARHLTVFLMTLLCWALIFTFAWFIADLLGIDVSVGYVFLIMPIVTLVELVPISVSGLGTREATVIYFFSVIGLGSVEAVGFSISYLILGTYLTALIGFFLWLKNPIQLHGD